MSLINDALKRAQEERLAPPGEMPGVPVYQKAPDTGLRREIGVIALLVILVVLLFGGLVGLLVYLRLRPAPVPPPGAPVVATATDASTPRTPQSRYGKAMDKAKTVAGQVAGLEREGRETAADLEPHPAPPAATPSAVVPPPPPAPAPPRLIPAPAAPAAAEIPPPPVPAAPLAAAMPVPPAAPAAPPAPVYKLTGIIGRAPTFTALVNGQLVKLHDRVGTAEVITLEPTRAVLREADGRTVELTISGSR